jgi:TRAP-type C4-dicarboxylate transport system permease small subunit
VQIVKIILKGFVDFLEIHLTAAIFLMMFFSFLTGVFFRYVVRNPQPWTFELSQICILMLALLASSTTQREDGHVVFDMIYIRSSPKVQNIMRIITSIIIVVFFGIAIPHSIKYLWGMRGLYMQVIKIPRYYVFMPLPILLITMFIRYAHRLFLDVKELKNKTFGEIRNTETGGAG